MRWVFIIVVLAAIAIAVSNGMKSCAAMNKKPVPPPPSNQPGSLPSQSEEVEPDSVRVAESLEEVSDPTAEMLGWATLPRPDGTYAVFVSTSEGNFTSGEFAMGRGVAASITDVGIEFKRSDGSSSFLRFIPPSRVVVSDQPNISLLPDL